MEMKERYTAPEVEILRLCAVENLAMNESEIDGPIWDADDFF